MDGTSKIEIPPVLDAATAVVPVIDLVFSIASTLVGVAVSISTSVALPVEVGVSRADADIRAPF
jgi:hypothetical protein